MLYIVELLTVCNQSCIKVLLNLLDIFKKDCWMTVPVKYFTCRHCMYIHKYMGVLVTCDLICPVGMPWKPPLFNSFILYWNTCMIQCTVELQYEKYFKLITVLATLEIFKIQMVWTANYITFNTDRING